jgi:hypothetical protein
MILFLFLYSLKSTPYWILRENFHLDIYGARHIHFVSLKGSGESFNLERLYSQKKKNMSPFLVFFCHLITF